MSDAAAGPVGAGAPAGAVRGADVGPRGAGHGDAGDAGAAPRWDLALVAAGGALACWSLSAAPPAAPGARVVFSAPVLLAAFDTLTALLVARPAPRRRAADVLAMLVVAAPFHMALAAGAGVPLGTAGFHVAWGVGLVAWGAAGVVAARAADAHADGGRPALLPSAVVASIATALPLAAYGAAEFLGWRSRAPFLASPLTGPSFLVHDGAFAAAADSLWPVAAAAVVCVAAVVARRLRGGVR